MTTVFGNWSLGRGVVFQFGCGGVVAEFEALMVIPAPAGLRLYVERLVAVYVDQYNTVMPHAAFEGHTPDEVYFRQRPELEEELREARRRAQAERMLANRALAREDCLERESPSELMSREAA